MNGLRPFFNLWSVTARFWRHLVLGGGNVVIRKPAAALTHWSSSLSWWSSWSSSISWSSLSSSWWGWYLKATSWFANLQPKLVKKLLSFLDLTSAPSWVPQTDEANSQPRKASNKLIQGTLPKKAKLNFPDDNFGLKFFNLWKISGPRGPRFSCSCLQTHLTSSWFMFLKEVEAYLGARGREFWRLTPSLHQTPSRQDPFVNL